MWYWKLSSLSRSPLCCAFPQSFCHFFSLLKWKSSPVHLFATLCNHCDINLQECWRKICFQKCTYGLCRGATLGTCFLFSLLLPRRISCWARLRAIIYYCSISLTASSVSAAQGSGPNMEMRKVPKKQSLPIPQILAFVCSLSAWLFIPSS